MDSKEGNHLLLLTNKSILGMFIRLKVYTQGCKDARFSQNRGKENHDVQFYPIEDSDKDLLLKISR